MKVVQPSFEILAATPDMTLLIERAIRTAYKSEDRIEPGSAEKIISLIKSKKHESTLEHGVITVKIITDRGISHELVRHRFFSPTQESTRYNSYNKGKYGSEITVVDLATGFKYDLNNSNDQAKYAVWSKAMASAESAYLEMIELGATAQEARSVLPNSLKTEIVITANVREWRHACSLRTSKEAHPQAVQIMSMVLEEFKKRWEILFNDINP